MFQALGSFVDRYGITLIGIVGVALLALFSTIWSNAADSIGPTLLVGLIVMAAVASGASGLLVTARAARQARKVESELLTAVRTTLVPLAEQFISMDSTSPTTMQDAATMVTMRCQAFVARAGATCDANLYKLTGTDLVRVNRPSGSARRAFRKSKKRDPKSIEESRVVERVLNGETVFCPDVRKDQWQKELSLAPGRRSYLAFMSVPFRDADGTVIGMLSLNSAKKGVITPLHEEYLEAVGRIYAAWKTDSGTHGQRDAHRA